MGGSPKTPSLPPTPDPSPMPMQPTSTAPISTEGQRAAKVTKIKQGMLSTIKTSPQGAYGVGRTIRTSPAGVTGTGSDLNSGEGKKTLGS